MKVMGGDFENQESTEKAVTAESKRLVGIRCLARMIARAYLQKAESSNEASKSEKKAE
jgi:hypothetical protein